MNKIILGILLLAGMASAAIFDPVMEQKYGETECWAGYADDLISFAQGYYDTPPAYLENMRDELSNEGGEMHQLFMCMEDDDRACFNAQLKNVMNLVRKMQATFWKESILAIIRGDETVGDVSSFFSFITGELQTCLEGGVDGIDPPPGPGPV